MRGHSVLVRFGAPALFLAAVTAAIVLVRAGLRNDTPAAPAPAVNAGASVVSRRVTPARKPKRFYLIKAGDTLGAVADRVGTSVDRLLELNPGVLPTSLRIGQKIRTA
jgi:LysM repeat protein